LGECSSCSAIEVRLYDRLFKVENVAEAEGDFKDQLNPNSLIVQTAYAEQDLLTPSWNQRYQFLRKGYFYLDEDTTKKKLVFNRTVALRDMWAKTVK
jgi:glutaminyl-tRNA synthetase